MQRAVIFIENTAIRRNHLIEVARRARQRDYATLLIHGKQLSPPEGIFDEMVEVASWTHADILHQCQCFERHYSVCGLLNLTRVFTEDGLIGAVVADVAKDMGLPHESSAALCQANNKYAMRDALKSKGIRTVEFALISQEEDVVHEGKRLGYPVVLKPLTGAFSHLILKCHDAQAGIRNFRLALQKLPSSHFSTFYKHPHVLNCADGQIVSFSPSRQMLLEQYIPGREVSVECLAQDDTVIPLLLHEKLIVTEAATTSYEDLLITPPVSFSDDDIEAMKHYAVETVQAIGLTNSFVHVELRFDPAAGPQLLEINPRVGGGKIPQSFFTCRGIDVFAAELNLALGLPVHQQSLQQEPPHYAMFFLFPPSAGRLVAVGGIDEVKKMPGMIEIEQTYAVGEEIYGDDQECFLIQGWMKGINADHILKTYHDARRLINIEVQP